MSDEIEVHGLCEERFEPVKEAFADNFRNGLDIGASFALTIDGKYAVDIWAGWADAEKKRPWEENSIINFFSTTKILTALCTLMLVDRGVLDLDAPVAKYWPEFAQGGKEKLPLRYLLSHTSGLSGYKETLTIEDLFDWDKLTTMLASQEPWWEPGTRSGYHATTFGYLLGEVIRRVTGKTPGTFFQEEVAKPLKADIYIGLPEEHDKRVADLIQEKTLFYRFARSKFVRWAGRKTLTARSVGNPIIEAEDTFSRAWRAAESPAANGHGNARSVAKIGSVIACSGEVDGIKFLSKQTIKKALEEQIVNKDLVTMQKLRFGLGLGLPFEGKIKKVEIPNKNVLYWGGYGGSLCIMDIDARMCFAFVMNKMRFPIGMDKRHDSLITAIYKVLKTE